MTENLKKEDATDAIIQVVKHLALIKAGSLPVRITAEEYDIMMLGLLEALEIVRGE